MCLREKHQLLMGLCLMTFTCYAITGLSPPFSQILLEGNGVGDNGIDNDTSTTDFDASHTEDFSLYNVNMNIVVFYSTMCVCSLIFGCNIVALSPHFLLLAGMFLYGGNTIVSAFIALVRHHDAFYKLSLVAKVIGGCGKAMTCVGTFALVGEAFHKKLGVSFAWVLLSACLGLLAGPFIGGLIGEAMDPIWPAVILGSIFLITMYPAACVIGIHVDKNQTIIKFNTSLLATLGSSYVLVYIISIFCAAYSLSFVLHNQTEYLIEMIPYTKIKVIYLSMGLSAGIAALIAGSYNSGRRLQPPLGVTFMGSLIATFASLLLGPAPFIHIEAITNVDAAYIIASVLLTCGTIAQLVGGYTGMTGSALDRGMLDHISTHGIIAALWNSAFVLGFMLGPSFGRLLAQSLGYRCATMFLTGMGALVAISAIFCMIHRRSSRAERRIARDTTPMIPVVEDAPYSSAFAHLDSVRSSQSFYGSMSETDRRSPSVYLGPCLDDSLNETPFHSYNCQSEEQYVY